jgi:hypothetical protein
MVIINKNTYKSTHSHDVLTCKPAQQQRLECVQGVGGFFLLLLIVNSGFIIIHNAIPPWVIAFYWLSPFAYSIRALVINEFTSPRWDAPMPGGDKTIGVAALESLDFYTDRYSQLHGSV